MLIVGLGMSWFATRKYRAEQQRKAADEIKQIGGSVCYDYQHDDIGEIIKREFDFGPIELITGNIHSGENNIPHDFESLRIRLGDDFFSDVKLVDLGPCQDKVFHHLKEPVDGLRYVETLCLSGNLITDTELEHFSALPRLKRLSISSDQITNSGFRVIDKYQQLQCLNIYKCPNLKASGFKSLSKLTKLKTLILTENETIYDTGFKFLNDLTNLEELNLSYSYIKNAGLTYLKDLKKLEKLNLSSCGNLTGDALKYLKDLKSLNVLDVSYDRGISGDGLKYLNGLSKLRELYLQETGITDSELEKLNDLPELETLALGGTGTTGIGLNLEKSKTIKDLTLGSCHITYAGLEQISRLTSLKKLDLSDNSQITDAGLKFLCNLTSLEELNLSNNSQITNAGIKYLNSLSNLQFLDLTNTKATATGVKKLQQLLPKCNITHREAKPPLKSEKQDAKSKDEVIRGYDLPGLARIPEDNDDTILSGSIVTDADIKHLKSNKKLRRLDLSNSQITDQGLKELQLQSHPLLEKLNVANTQITNAGIMYISRMINLRDVDLGFMQISDDELGRLSQIHLHSLAIHSNRVTDRGLKYLQKLDLFHLVLGSNQITDTGLAYFDKRNRSRAKIGLGENGADVLGCCDGGDNRQYTRRMSSMCRARSANCGFGIAAGADRGGTGQSPQTFGEFLEASVERYRAAASQTGTQGRSAAAAKKGRTARTFPPSAHAFASRIRR